MQLSPSLTVTVPVQVPPLTLLQAHAEQPRSSESVA
jgi:hypothetical protein